MLTLDSSMIRVDEKERFSAQGFVILGKRVSPDEIERMKWRLDEIMWRGRECEHLLMQLDSTTGLYADAGEQTVGWKGATGAYRKIEGIESDSVFSDFLASDFVRTALRLAYGGTSEIRPKRIRAMIMNKPAHGGTRLPWHQDRWQWPDYEPSISVYVAIDRAYPSNGCIQVVPGSHALGLLNPSHHRGVLSDQQVTEYCHDCGVEHLALSEGEVVLMHSRLLHASGLNHTPFPRRALSVLV